MKKIIQVSAIILCLLGGIVSCKKEEFNINANPNQATDSTIIYNVILPAALNNTARLVTQNWGWLQNYLGYWARSGTYAPNTAEETYDITTGFQSQIWTNIYDNLYDYEVMRISAEKEGADFYAGIARIMKAHDFALLVDIYNDVPYTEALKGGANTTPKYDKAADIYKDLLRQIDTGISLIKDANVSASGPNKDIPTDDIMFGGSGVDILDIQPLWVQFGNTLKLRLLTHLTGGGILSPATTVPGFDIPAEIAVIEAEGTGFLNVDAEVNPGYSSVKPNPFFTNYVSNIFGTGSVTNPNSVYYKANSYATDESYSVDGDPRIARFYKPGNQGYKGVAYGLPSMTENAAAELAGIGDGVIRGYDKPVWILTNMESHFLQAEAINRGFLSGDASVELVNGIYASFTMLGVANPISSADTYIANNATFPDVDYGASSLDPGNLPAGGLATIIEQKWFGFNAIAPYEVWTDYRRINFSSSVDHYIYGISGGRTAGPPISVSPNKPASVTEIPVRLKYPQSEFNYNPSNVINITEVFGTSPQTRIFWDLQ